MVIEARDQPKLLEVILLEQITILRQNLVERLVTLKILLSLLL
jgi:hypothetical protein